MSDLHVNVVEIHPVDGTAVVELDGIKRKKLGTAWHLALRERPDGAEEGCSDWIKSVVIADTRDAALTAISKATGDEFRDDLNTAGCSCASKETRIYRVVNGTIANPAGEIFKYCAAEDGAFMGKEFIARSIVLSNEGLDNQLFKNLWDIAAGRCPGDTGEPGGTNPVVNVVGANIKTGTAIIFGDGDYEKSETAWKLCLRVGDGSGGCRDWVSDIVIGNSLEEVEAASGHLTSRPGTKGCSFASLRTSVWRVDSGSLKFDKQYNFAIAKSGKFNFATTGEFIVDELVVTNTDPETATGSLPVMWKNALNNCPDQTCKC